MRPFSIKSRKSRVERKLKEAAPVKIQSLSFDRKYDLALSTGLSGASLLHLFGDWSGGLALGDSGGAGGFLVSLARLLLVLGSSDGVFSLLLSDLKKTVLVTGSVRLAYLGLLELLVEDLGVAESSDSLGGLDVTSNTSLHGSFLANLIINRNSARALDLPDALLVLASVEDGPFQLSGVLLGVVQAGNLVVEHSDDLAVGSAVAHAMAGVDLEAAEVTKLSAHISESRRSI